MQLYTKAVLTRLGRTAVVLFVAMCVYLIAMYAGWPQMPTVGWILVGMVIVMFVLEWVFKSGN
jgi:hypothetical protein